MIARATALVAGVARAAGRGGRARHLFAGNAREVRGRRLLPHHPAEHVRRLRVRSRHVLSRDAGDRARPSGRRLVSRARGVACVRGRVALERAGAGRTVRRRALHRAASRAAARRTDAGRGRLSAVRPMGLLLRHSLRDAFHRRRADPPARAGAGARPRGGAAGQLHHSRRLGRRQGARHARERLEQRAGRGRVRARAPCRLSGAGPRVDAGEHGARHARHAAARQSDVSRPARRAVPRHAGDAGGRRGARRARRIRGDHPHPQDAVDAADPALSSTPISSARSARR